MTETIVQPDAAPLPDTLIDAILDVLGGEIGDARLVEVRPNFQHSNDLSEIRFDDGRTLVAKRGRYSWAKERMETARLAGRLLREHTDVLAPFPLELPEGIDEMPTQVYWRIDLPTLEELWPEMSRSRRVEAMRSWGRLATRLHRVRLPGSGKLGRAVREPVPLAEYLRSDLEDRLLPAVYGEWEFGAPVVHRLIELIPRVTERVRERSRGLVHNDFHKGNVLCRPGEDGVECVGVIDLENALAGPPEVDIASMQVLHGPLFERPIEAALRAQARSAYGEGLDAAALSYFRLNHLANLGFYSALIGHDWHAQVVGGAAFQELERLEEELAR